MSLFIVLRETVEEASKHTCQSGSAYCVVQQAGHFLAEPHPEFQMIRY